MSQNVRFQDADNVKTQKVFRNDSVRFETWEVGSRYICSELLGKGSYGQVAKAIDL